MTAGPPRQPEQLPQCSPADAGQLKAAVASLEWETIERDLDSQGYAILAPLLTAGQCQSLRHGFADESLYRKHIVMARHGYGRGEYKYFADPLPPAVLQLRESIYPRLAPIANRWNETMKIAARFPPDHGDFRLRCHEAGQCNPTPLMLRYEPGDFNCLHQDLYGEHVFPLQVAILLSEPEQDFTGGEFVLTEQRPRMQSRVEVVPLCRGAGVVFPVRHRPAAGRRGYHRVNLRHGVSRLRTGERFTLGIIFHDSV